MFQITIIDLHEQLLDEEFFVSQCLEYDIKGIGATVAEARDDFNRRLQAQMLQDKINGVFPLSTIPPSPKKLWDIYNEAAKNGMKIDPL